MEEGWGAGVSFKILCAIRRSSSSPSNLSPLPHPHLNLPVSGGGEGLALQPELINSVTVQPSKQSMDTSFLPRTGGTVHKQVREGLC